MEESRSRSAARMISRGAISPFTRTVAILAVALSCAAGPMQAADQDPEPFGRIGLDLVDSPLSARWRALEGSIGADKQVLAACQAHPDACGSPAAVRFLAIIDDARAQRGRAQLGAINRDINLAIRWTDDSKQYGTAEPWTPPLVTLAAGRGGCMDYAVAKYVALEEVGLPEADLRIVIGRNLTAKENHALLAVHLDEHWFILDNRSLVIVEDVELKNYLPLFAMNAAGVKQLYVLPIPDDTRLRDKVADAKTCAAARG